MTEEVEVDHKVELEKAYRCIRGLFGCIAAGKTPDRTMVAYHALTLGAALRFVNEGKLDGSAYFIGKPVEVLRETMRGYGGQ